MSTVELGQVGHHDHGRGVQATRGIRNDTVYVTERLDITAEIPSPAGPADGRGPPPNPAAQQLYFERTSALGAVPGATMDMNYARGACLSGTDDAPARYTTGDQRWQFYAGGAGDFLLASRAAIFAVRGAPEMPTNTIMDSMTVYALLAHGYGQLVLRPPCNVYHQPHPRNEATKRLASSTQPIFSLYLSLSHL